MTHNNNHNDNNNNNHSNANNNTNHSNNTQSTPSIELPVTFPGLPRLRGLGEGEEGRAGAEAYNNII